MSLVLASSNGTDTAVSGLAANPLALRVLNSDVDWNLEVDTPDRKVYRHNKGPLGYSDSILIVFTPIKDIYKGLPIEEGFKSIYRSGLNVMWQYNGLRPETDTVDTEHIAYVPYMVRNVFKLPMHPSYTDAIALKDAQTAGALIWAKGIAATSGTVITNLLRGTRKY